MNTDKTNARLMRSDDRGLVCDAKQCVIAVHARRNLLAVAGYGA